MRGGHQVGGPPLKRLMSRTAGLTLHWFAGVPTHDPTNNFKLYSRRFLDTVTIESTAGFELALELTVKATLARRRVAEVPTTWRDRTAGQSNFKLRKWLPHYLHWYWAAFRGRLTRRREPARPRCRRIATQPVVSYLPGSMNLGRRRPIGRGRSDSTIIGVEILWIVYAIAVSLGKPSFGLDYRWHVEAAQRLLDTGTPYLPFELAGPFAIGDGAILYPPTAFLLFIPFIWLPAVLWWAIPIAVLAYGLWWHRPPLWAWVVMRVDPRLRQVAQRLRVREPVDVGSWPPSPRAPSGAGHSCSSSRSRPSRPSRSSAFGAGAGGWRLAVLGVDVAVLPARLVRLVHGRAQLGRPAPLQPADAAAHRWRRWWPGRRRVEPRPAAVLDR